MHFLKIPTAYASIGNKRKFKPKYPYCFLFIPCKPCVQFGDIEKQYSLGLSSGAILFAYGISLKNEIKVNKTLLTPLEIIFVYFYIIHIHYFERVNTFSYTAILPCGPLLTKCKYIHVKHVRQK